MRRWLSDVWGGRVKIRQQKYNDFIYFEIEKLKINGNKIGCTYYNSNKLKYRFNNFFPGSEKTAQQRHRASMNYFYKRIDAPERSLIFNQVLGQYDI